jgi:hypothetical protein
MNETAKVMLEYTKRMSEKLKLEAEGLEIDNERYKAAKKLRSLTSYKKRHNIIKEGWLIPYD